MKQAHDTNTPTNICETTEKADIIVAIEVVTTTTTNIQLGGNVGNADGQRKPGERQRLT